MPARPAYRGGDPQRRGRDRHSSLDIDVTICANPRTAREGYYLDPLAYLKLEQALRREGKRIKVIFHSHPDVGAYFSEEDRRQAMWGERPLYPGMVYLVCGIKQGRPDGAVLATYNEATGAFDQEQIAAAGTAGDAEVA